MCLRLNTDKIERGPLFFGHTTWHVHACTHAKSLQSCLTLCDRMDCSLPGSSVHGILQASHYRILIPRPGIEPVPTAVEVQSLTTGPQGIPNERAFYQRYLILEPCFT